MRCKRKLAAAQRYESAALGGDFAACAALRLRRGVFEDAFVAFEAGESLFKEPASDVGAVAFGAGRATGGAPVCLDGFDWATATSKRAPLAATV